MTLNVGKEVAAVKRMTVAQLRARHVEVFGEQTRSGHKEYLVKRIAWRLQSQAEGDLSQRARQRASELANDADLRTHAPHQQVQDGDQPGITRTAAVCFDHDPRVPLPGSFQVGLARKLLERYRWWDFEPHQEWVEPSGSAENVRAPFAAGIAGKVRVIYFYDPILPWGETPTKVVAIEPDIEYKAFFWNPGNGDVRDLGVVEADANDSWQIRLQPAFEDGILVLDARGVCDTLLAEK